MAGLHKLSQMIPGHVTGPSRSPTNRYEEGGFKGVLFKKRKSTLKLGNVPIVECDTTRVQILDSAIS
jgi:hypothetical protein